MGAKITAFENRSKVDMEIRVFIPPARPDRYRKIIRIKPGEIKQVKIKYLCCEDVNQKDENPTFIMVFMDGIYSGISLLPFQIVEYAKLLGYLDEDTGELRLKGIKTRFGFFLRIRDSCKSWKTEKNKREESHVLHKYCSSISKPVATPKPNNEKIGKKTLVSM